MQGRTTSVWVWRVCASLWSDRYRRGTAPGVVIFSDRRCRAVTCRQQLRWGFLADQPYPTALRPRRRSISASPIGVTAGVTALRLRSHPFSTQKWEAHVLPESLR